VIEVDWRDQALEDRLDWFELHCPKLNEQRREDYAEGYRQGWVQAVKCLKLHGLIK
jgi:hypothetical protein